MLKRVVSFCFLIAAFLGTQCATLHKTTPKIQQLSPEEIAERYAVIPLPKVMIPKENDFHLTPQTAITCAENEETQSVVLFFTQLVQQAAGIALKKAASATGTGLIHFVINEQVTGPAGSYRLSVTPERVEIQSANALGLFYGVQTLRQLLPPEIESPQPVPNVTWTIPCVEIQDEPRFSYRGLLLDVGRHFFPVEFIKKYIDVIAMYKMNTLHWHLTEDQGWRIEIKKHPKLTQIGAFRAETVIGHAGRPPLKYDGQRYGGFYTQEEIKAIVKYAESRFVIIIPEIEMPGHSFAALAAYPELGCTGGPYAVQTRWGVHHEVYCAGNDQVFQLLEDVLSEVIELFPGKYIHIGGDECPKKRWQKCPKCQARIQAEGLKDEHELQSYFIRRIEKFLLSKDRYLIGWDEILEGGLAPQATVMSWRGMKGGIEAARQGHNVIMTPTSHCYLDYYQTDPAGEPLAIGGFLPLKKVYSLEPVPEELNEQEGKHIIGAQGNVWTEYIATPEHAEYMTFPRACALAEVAWTPKAKKNWKFFQIRLAANQRHLKARKVNYYHNF